ncbi:MAG: hypothetical protein ABR593_01545, partial [Candidatus Limnocylindria bacterium]
TGVLLELRMPWVRRASGLDDPGDGLGGFGDHVAGLVLVAGTATWVAAVRAGAALPKSDLGTSAVIGAQRAAQS